MQQTIAGYCGHPTATATTTAAQTAQTERNRAFINCVDSVRGLMRAFDGCESSEERREMYREAQTTAAENFICGSTSPTGYLMQQAAIVCAWNYCRKGGAE